MKNQELPHLEMQRLCGRMVFGPPQTAILDPKLLHMQPFKPNQTNYCSGFQLTSHRWSRFDQCLCCNQKARAAIAQSYTLWQQATIEITCHYHSILACRATYVWVLFFANILFVVNRTFNATPTERLQHLECTRTCNFLESQYYYAFS